MRPKANDAQYGRDVRFAGHKQISNKTVNSYSFSFSTDFSLLSHAFNLMAMAAGHSWPGQSNRPVTSFRATRHATWPGWIVKLDLYWARICNCSRLSIISRCICAICIKAQCNWSWHWSCCYFFLWQQEQPGDRLTHYVIILLQRVIGGKLLPPNDKCMSQKK